MKKSVLLILIFALALSSAFALSGEGTAINPYKVANISDLLTISNDTGLWDKYFNQIANIDASITLTLNDGAGFSPIGTDNINFSGSYDGQNYTISNLYINREDSEHIGLFGYSNGANISNVGLVDNEISGPQKTGSLVGYLVNASSINNCYATGSVNGTNWVGGLVAYSQNSQINNSYTTGFVSGWSSVGGLVGQSDSSTISNCHATGSLSQFSSQIGGLVGYANSSTVTNCFATGSMGGYSQIGGLVGSSDFSTITNCYATGTLSGYFQTGGLVGSSGNSTISNCYSTGVPTGENHIGGLVGLRESGSVANSFWDTETSGKTTSAGGTGQTTQQMKTLSTYANAGWDFSNIWTYLNNDYPHLIWETPFISDTTPATPENIQITMSGNSANITWDAVAMDVNGNLITINHYKAYYNDQGTDNDADFVWLADITGTTYIHTNAGLTWHLKFYRIKAYLN